MSKTIRIIQNLLDEHDINASFINKLYNMINRKEIYNEETINLDNSNFIGDTYVNGYTYREYINKINEYFKQLHIYPLGTYIKFEDSVIEQILLNAGIGDGIGITEDLAAEVTSLPSFTDNTNITSFNELHYFTKVKTITANQFKGCTNLTSIDLSNITTLYENAFQSSGITHADLSNLKTIYGNEQFKNCTSLIDIVYPSNTYVSNGMFYGCTNLTSIGVDWSLLGYLDARAFAHCQSLTGDIILNYKDTKYYGGTLCDTGFTNIKIISNTISTDFLGYSSGAIEYNAHIVNVPNCNIIDLTECSIKDIVGVGIKDTKATWLLLPPSANKINAHLSCPSVDNIVISTTEIPSGLSRDPTWYEWNDGPGMLYWVPDSVYNSWLTSAKFNNSTTHLRMMSQLPQNIKNIYANINIDCNNL